MDIEIEPSYDQIEPVPDKSSLPSAKLSQRGKVTTGLGWEARPRPAAEGGRGKQG
jgi:hypothetical protein